VAVADSSLLGFATVSEWLLLLLLLLLLLAPLKPGRQIQPAHTVGKGAASSSPTPAVARGVIKVQLPNGYEPICHTVTADARNSTVDPTEQHIPR
jgi:hypothetical protein